MVRSTPSPRASHGESALKQTANRYDRQMLIPGWDQPKLRRAKVFIAGIGALGNEVAKNLALAGVGNLLLLDYDRVEYTNLNRSVLFCVNDVGSPKVKAASRSIRRLNPSTKVTIFNETLQELLKRDARVLKKPKALVGCLDNREARFILNHVSVARRIPYVDGGMLSTIGSIRVSIPPYTPCLECGTPESAYTEVGQRYRCEEIVYEDLTAEQMAIRHPTVSTVTSVTAAIQSHEILKILLGMDLFRSRGTWAQGTGRPVENEIQYDCRTNGFLIRSFHRDVECYVCGTRGTSIDPVRPITVRVSSEDRVADIVAKVQPALKTQSFNLVKGLKPFPDRTAAISEARNLFQNLEYLSRLLAKSALVRSRAQECYRVLRTCLESSTVARARDLLRWGVPFRPKDLVLALDMVRDAIETLDSKACLSRWEHLPTVREIHERIARTSLGNDLTVQECGLLDRDVLCAIGSEGSRFQDMAIEVALRPSVG